MAYEEIDPGVWGIKDKYTETKDRTKFVNLHLKTKNPLFQLTHSFYQPCDNIRMSLNDEYFEGNGMIFYHYALFLSNLQKNPMFPYEMRLNAFWGHTSFYDVNDEYKWEVNYSPSIKIITKDIEIELTFWKKYGCVELYKIVSNNRNKGLAEKALSFLIYMWLTFNMSTGKNLNLVLKVIPMHPSVCRKRLARWYGSWGFVFHPRESIMMLLDYEKIIQNKKPLPKEMVDFLLAGPNINP